MTMQCCKHLDIADCNEYTNTIAMHQQTAKRKMTRTAIKTTMQTVERKAKRDQTLQRPQEQQKEKVE